MASISLQGISRCFPGGVQALDSVSFEIHDSEVVTIVGPSGCGKSTLLRIIAGLDFPTAGTILIDGTPAHSAPARLRNFAMVFQSYALYPHMTSYDNLALNLRLKKIPAPDVDRRVRETARLLEIEDLLAKLPRDLSGGQRQRVAVGRALIRKPRAFLFDEPLSNLDALLRERVRHELKELFKKINATVIYVTHDQVEAMTLADRVVVLDAGKVQQVGTPEELYKHPSNRFVGTFIGSPSMNTFETVLTEGRLRIGTEFIEIGLDWNGPVFVGIRPEAIRLAPSGIRARVAWVENLGAHYLLGVQAGDVSLILLASDRPASESVKVQIDPEDIHVFDKRSGQTLVGDGVCSTAAH
jgi:sn-glycerol 3-phosphate transport system ATP-binding protein